MCSFAVFSWNYINTSISQQNILRNRYVNIAQRVMYCCVIPKHSRYVKKATFFTQQLCNVTHSCVMFSLRNGYATNYAIQYVSVLCLHYVIVAWQVMQQVAQQFMFQVISQVLLYYDRQNAVLFLRLQKELLSVTFSPFNFTEETWKLNLQYCKLDLALFI